MIVTRCQGLVFTAFPVEREITEAIITQDLPYQNLLSSSMQQNNFLFLCKAATRRGAAGKPSGDVGSYTTPPSFTSGGS